MSEYRDPTAVEVRNFQKQLKGIQINNHFQNDASKVETIEFHDGSTLDISNADQLIQAMNSFSVGSSASTDTLSNPTQDVSEMYSLVASVDLTKKAIQKRSLI